MKKLISLVLVLSQLLPASTLAAISGPDRADIPAPINAVTNSSGQRGLAGWVKGGAPTVFTVVTSAGNKAAGVSSFAFNSASNADYVETAALTLTDDTTGDCEASIAVKGDGSLYSLQLMSGASVLYSMALTNNTGFKTHAFNYPCGTGYKLRVASSGDGASINFGAVYWGKATNLGAINPAFDAQPYTSILTNAGNATPTFKVGRVGDKAVVSGSIVIGSSLPTDKIFFTLPYPLDSSKMPKGITGADDYQFLGTANFRVAATGNMYNGHVLRYSTSNTTAQFVTAGDEGLNLSWSNTAPVTMAAGDVITIDEFSYPVQGWTAQTAVRQDQTFDRTGEVMSYMGACPANTVSGMNKTIGKASGDYQGSAYFALYSKLWRSGMATSGYGATISSATGASATADWDAGKTIRINLTDQFLRGVGTSNTATGQAQGQATAKNGLYNSASTVTGSVGGGDGGHTHGDNGHGHNIQAGGIFAQAGSSYGVTGTGGAGWSGTGYAQINSTGSGHGHSFSLTAGAQTLTGDTETRPVNVGVNYCVNYTGTQPAPVLVGSVTSNTSGMERIERVKIQGSNCAMVSQSSPWVTVSGSNSAAACVGTYATKTFSATPVCTCTTSYNGSADSWCAFAQNSPDTVSFIAYVRSAAGVGTASDINVICMGPR